jgi:hypothetical protein
MNVGELRAALSNMPDSKEVIMVHWDESGGIYYSGIWEVDNDAAASMICQRWI